MAEQKTKQNKKKEHLNSLNKTHHQHVDISTVFFL